jgi:hypothetical protein
VGVGKAHKRANYSELKKAKMKKGEKNNKKRKLAH